MDRYLKPFIDSTEEQKGIVTLGLEFDNCTRRYLEVNTLIYK